MVNKIIDYCSRNIFIVSIFTIFLFVGSIVAIKHTPLDALPDLSDVQVIVFTEWKGRNPRIIEDQITYPITTKLLSAPKVRDVRAQSFYGFSFIYTIFEEGTDIYWARSRVLEYLNSIQGQLPKEVNPVIGPDATGVGWVYQYVLVDKENKYDLSYLKTINDWYLRYWLSAVPGVAEVASIGGFEKQYQIEVDPNKLRAYKISLATVFDAVRKSNNDTGARTLEIAGHEYLINVSGYIQKLEDIKQVVVGAKPNGVPIRIQDIANVHLGPNMRRGIGEYNGQGEAVSGIIVMRFGENALKVITDIKKKIKEIKKGLPEGLEIEPVYDRSDLILRSVDNLKNTLILEFIASALIVFIFLFHFRSSFVGLFTLPLAMMATFIPMYFLGVNSNIMSLAGIGIAIGDMVDSSIVMVENAHKHLEEWEKNGKKGSRTEIIINAAKEVGPSLFAALLIITVSFLPIFALEAQEGRLFKPLAITKTLAMFFASFFAITITPALMVLFIRGKIVKERDNPLNKFLLVTYEPIARFVLRNPYKVVILSIIFFLVSLPVITRIGTEFMPPLNEGTILYMPTASPGIGVSEAARITHIQDKLIMKVPEVESVFGKAGRADTPTDPAPLEMWETIINLKPKEKWRPGITWEKIIEELDKLVHIPGTVNAWIMPIKTRIDMLSTGVKTPVGIKIYGSDLKVIEKIGEHIEGLIKQVKGTRSVFSERTASGYYIEINLNRELIGRHGLTIDDVELNIQAGLGGEEITTTIEGKERYTVNIRYPREFRDSPGEIKNIYLMSPNGYQIPLSQVASIKLVKGPTQIRDENGSLVGYVYVDIEDIDVGTYVKNARKLLDKELDLPTGYTIEWSGQYEYIQRMFKKLAILVPLTIFIIFLFCYLTFHSFAKTAMVMLYIPFAVLGGVWYLFFNGFNFSIAVAVGFIGLAGMSMETAMVMIVFLDEAIERFKKEGRLNTASDLKEAVIEGAVRRLRPKLMTIATDIAAFLPIMFSAGTGSDVMQRMAAPLIGGTVTSTILILGILPAVYYLWRMKELKLKLKA